MQRGLLLSVSVVALVALLGAVEVAAKDPIFVRWMVPDDPGDRAILDYWERSERQDLSPEELIDLGTMLFYRGYPKDAIRYFEQALDADPNLIEAWYRIGLVEHKRGSLRQARQAYDKCLKMSSGHGWCNFYKGLLEEQTNHPPQALEHYRRAFRHAPELADPRINPEVLYSKLVLGAIVRHEQEIRFTQSLPMPLLQPARVEKAMARRDNAGVEPARPDAQQQQPQEPQSPVAQEPAAETSAEEEEASAPTPTARASTNRRVRPMPRPTPTPPPDGRAGASKEATAGRGVHGVPGGGGTDTGDGLDAPRLSDVSPEASLTGQWPRLPDPFYTLNRMWTTSPSRTG